MGLKPGVKFGEILKSCALDRLVFSATMNDYRVHTGVDFAAPLGTEVYCFAAGTVESVKDDPLWGITVTVRHEEGLVSVYANLDPELASGVYAGQQFAAGDLLGYVGGTALAEKADPPHLHFEMLLNGVHIDPEKELAKTEP
jgi:murein DD-endopeptidase MepM/ murein hydrolase activator NlpD